MKNQIRPLCLSFWSPPTVRPQAILIGKMIPEWIAQSIEPVILTYANQGDWDIKAPIYKIEQFKLNRIMNRIPPLRAYFRYRYQQKLVKTIARIIKKHDINIVFSFANPQESNLIGALVKEKIGVPFISHFSDPWYDNPCVTMSPWRAKRVLKQETKIIKNSDAVVFINNNMRDIIMKKYPREWAGKSAVIHHSFAPTDYPLSSKQITTNKDKNKFIFSYVGVFYKERNPEIIFQALQRIIQKDGHLASKINFQIVGCDGGYTDFPIDAVKTLIEKYKLENIVSLIPRVDYHESLRYMQLADCLILIDVRYKQSYCLPSKLIDYAGSGSAILGIANQNSPVADFLRKLGDQSFTYDQIDGLSLHIRELITGENKINKNIGFLNQFNVTSTTQQLLGLFTKMLSKK